MNGSVAVRRVQGCGGRVARIVGALAALGCLTSAPAGAEPADLDPAFGGGGVVLSSLGASGGAAINDLVLQPDGKLVAAARVELPKSGGGVTGHFAVARFTADGALDTTFNAGGPTPGVRVTQFSAAGSTAKAVTIGPSGEIVAVGTAGESGGETALIQRLDSTGAIDPTFGTFNTNFGQDEASLADVAVRPDGKILVAGSAKFGGEQKVLLAQVLLNGAGDSSFGASGSGRVMTQFGGTLSSARALEIDSAGRPVVAGFATTVDGNRMLYARYTAAGALDVHQLHSFDGVPASASALALMPDGRAVLAGSTAPPPRALADIAVMRVLADGTADATFGAAGTPGKFSQQAGDGRFALLNDVMLLADGKVRVAGVARDGSQNKALTAQYTAAGQPDSGFSSTGANTRMYVIGDGGASSLSAITLLPSGLYMVAGMAANGGADRGLLARAGTPKRSPLASFTNTGGTGSKPIRPGQTVQFDAAGSSDPDGSIARYEWDLDGNGSFETEGATASRSYPSHDNISVTLRVTDNDGLQGQTSRTVNVVQNAAPTAVIQADYEGIAKHTAEPRYNVPFNLTGAESADSDGSIVKYEWSRDGEPGFERLTGSDPKLVWTPTQAGPWTVRLQVTDDEGATSDVGRTFDVAKAEFSVEVDYRGGSPTEGLVLKRGGTGVLGIKVKNGPGAGGGYQYAVDPQGAAGFKTEFVKEAEGTDDRALRVNAGPNAPDQATLKVKVTSSPEAGSTTHQVLIPVTQLPAVDARIVGIEVTQGIQKEHEPCDLEAVIAPGQLPSGYEELAEDLCTKNESLPAPAKSKMKIGKREARWQLYSGVQLVRGKKTVARVFANTPEGELGEFSALLHAYDHGGKPLPGSPIYPLNQPKTLEKGLPHVTFLERSKGEAPFTFLLPPAWTKKSPVLEAKLLAVPGEAVAGACKTDKCKANDSLALRAPLTPGLHFLDTGYIRVGTAKLDGAGGKVTTTPEVAYGMAAQWAPLRDGGLRYDPQKWYAQLKYPNSILTEDKPRKALRTFLDDYADDENDDNGCGGDEFCADQVVGIFKATSGKLRGGVSMGGIVDSVQDPVAISEETPWVVAHELYHGFAETEHTFGPPANYCDNSEDRNQLGESIDASGEGLLNGIGLDVSGAGPKSDASPYRVIAPRILGGWYHHEKAPQPKRYWDVLSYCMELGATDTWIAVGGWERLLGHVLEIAGDEDRFGASAAAVRKRPVLHVQADLDQSGAVEVVGVKPRTGRPSTESTPGWTVRALDAGGATVGEAPLSLGSDHGAPYGLLSGTVDGRGATAVEILREGSVVARRDASPSAPSIELLSPRKGQRLPSRGAVAVRWKAGDRDGDELIVRVEYSIDGGRDWRTLSLAGNEGSLSLPAHMFAGSRDARVRVRANDGFLEGQAVSGRLTAAGTPPSVEILSPESGARMALGATPYLSGQASDDRSLPLVGNRLTWFAGRRRIGTGEQPLAEPLPAGRHRIRLVARDRFGRRASATRVIRVRPAPPLFERLEAPSKLSPRARRLPLRVAANVPARLRVGKRAYAVGPKPRTLRIPVKHGRKPVRLKLRLGSGRHVSTRTLTIRRA